MIRFHLLRTSLAVLLAVPAYADLTQTALMRIGFYVNLDTGKLLASGTPAANDVYDLQWFNNRVNNAMAPQGKAKIINVGVRTADQFAAIAESDVRNRLSVGTMTPIPESTLVPGDVFFVLTNAGNPSKVMVSGESGGTIGITFTTFQAAAPGAPVIKEILNNSSRITTGLPNYGIAPSSLFVITGTNLADPGQPVLQSSADPGLPLTLNGASITVTVNGVTTHPALYYTSPGQLAAVLPANTPPGSGTLTVTYNGVASAAAPIKVVQSAVGLNTYGTNTGVATDALTGAVLTFANAGAPGEIVVLWATGLGADPADSDSVYSPSPHAVNTSLQIFMGGVQAKILYQGSAGYPGVNQINVVIPDSAPSGCWVSVVAVTGVVPSNIATLPIAKGGGPCLDPGTGLDGSHYFPGGTVTFRAGTGGVILSSAPDGKGNRTIQYSAGADFSKYSGVSYDPPHSLTPGSCIISEQEHPVVVGLTGLDAGSIKLTGPAGLSVALGPQLGIKGAYYAALPDGSIPQTGGAFTLSGSGGADVGSFSTTINLSNPLLTWTNSSSITDVNKSQGVTVTWTGGNPGTYVYVTGGSSFHVPGQTVTVANFECLAPVDAGQFTVPSWVLQALPDGSGGLAVQNIILVPFSASGLDIASAGAYVGYSIIVSYGSGATR